MFAVATAFKVDKSEISKVSNSKLIFIQIRLMTPIFKHIPLQKSINYFEIKNVVTIWLNEPVSFTIDLGKTTPSTTTK